MSNIINSVSAGIRLKRKTVVAWEHLKPLVDELNEIGEAWNAGNVRLVGDESGKVPVPESLAAMVEHCIAECGRLADRMRFINH